MIESRVEFLHKVMMHVLRAPALDLVSRVGPAYVVV